MKAIVCLVLLGIALVAQARPQSSGEAASSSVEKLGYSFTYAISEEDSKENKLDFGHNENRSDESDITRGSYHILLPDTRLMTVTYYVDDLGFHPTITYEGEAVYPESEEFSSEIVNEV